MARVWYNPGVVVDPSAVSWKGRYVREPRPLVFPVTQQVPETRRHYGLRTALFQILEAAFGDRATLGCDQFVYWNPTDPKACCAPDVMLRVGEPDALFDCWKIWERGAPHVAFEIVSKSDAEEWSWEKKLERYRQTGIPELVRFDADDAENPLRIWDLFDGDLVEREPAAPDFSKCRALGVHYHVRSDPKLGLMLGLAHDAAGADPFLTPDEARERAVFATREAEAATREAEAATREAEAARGRAEARVRELEAELARRGG